MASELVFKPVVWKENVALSIKTVLGISLGAEDERYLNRLVGLDQGAFDAEPKREIYQGKVGQLIDLLRRFPEHLIVLGKGSPPVPFHALDVQADINHQLRLGCPIFMFGDGPRPEEKLSYFLPVEWMTELTVEDRQVGYGKYRRPIFQEAPSYTSHHIRNMKRFRLVMHGLKTQDPPVVPVLQSFVDQYRIFVRDKQTASKKGKSRTDLELKDEFLFWCLDRVKYNFDFFGNLGKYFGDKNELSRISLGRQVSETVLNQVGRLGGVQKMFSLQVIIPATESPSPTPEVNPDTTPWAFDRHKRPVNLTQTEMVMVNLSYTDRPYGHQNTLLFDRNLGKLIYIEPHGKNIVYRERLPLMLKLVLKRLEQLYHGMGKPRVLLDFANALQAVKKGEAEYVYLNGSSDESNPRGVQALLEYDVGYCVTISMMQGLLLYFNLDRLREIAKYFEVNDAFIFLFTMTDSLDSVVRAVQASLLDIERNMTELESSIHRDERRFVDGMGANEEGLRFPARRRGATQLVPTKIQVSVSRGTLWQDKVSSSLTVRELADKARSMFIESGADVLHHQVMDGSGGERRIEQGNEADDRRIIDVPSLSPDRFGVYRFTLHAPAEEG